MKKQKQQGVSIFLAILVMTILLGLSFGLAAIFIGQARVLRGIGHSVLAFYAAETGLERVLRIDICMTIDDQTDRDDCIITTTASTAAPSVCTGPVETYDTYGCRETAVVDLNSPTNDTLGNGAFYDLVVRANGEGGCTGDNYCVAGKGTFDKSNRKNEISR